MKLTIDLAPQTEAWISAEAKHLGVLPADLVRGILDERAASTDSPHDPRERVRTLLRRWQALDRTPMLSTGPEHSSETPTTALFKRWEEEDASLTNTEQEADLRLWEAYQEGIDVERTQNGMRRIF
jgi:hypothetical protein